MTKRKALIKLQDAIVYTQFPPIERSLNRAYGRGAALRGRVKLVVEYIRLVKEGGLHEHESVGRKKVP
jgi:hypothetical protein